MNQIRSQFRERHQHKSAEVEAGMGNGQRRMLYDQTYPVLVYLRENTPPDAVILMPPEKYIDEKTPGDIPLLARHFLESFNREFKTSFHGFTPEVEDLMVKYDWPGNIRELRNIIEHAVIVSNGDLLHIQLPTEGRSKKFSSYAMADVERQHILDVLQLTNWSIKGANGAARKLAMNPSTLYSRMQKLGISRSS